MGSNYKVRVGERVMSVLSLGLQSVGLARRQLGDELEKDI